MVVIHENAEYWVRHYNFDRMTEYLGNDKETIKKVLLLVIKELKLSVRKFENYILHERLDDIKHTAHQLVKATASVGLDRLCTLIKKLEHLSSFDSNVLNHYIYALKSEIRLAKKLINGYL